MKNIIEIENLWYQYNDGTTALQGLTMQIPAGKKIALLGPNGAGKSTLLLHLNGINLPQKGTVTVLGQEINAKTEKWVRSKVGMVFQDPDDQVFATTVWEDVAFGPRNMKLTPREIEERTEQALRSVGMLDCRNKAPHHLSYGQKKRVAIAGVLAMEPEIIVLDEPVAYLDPKGKDDLFKILDALHEKGTTIIIATHDVDLAAEWVDEIVVVKKGNLLAKGGTILLADPTLIHEAELRFPVVVKIFQGLSEFETHHGDMPLTIEEAIAFIRQLRKKT